MDERPSNVVEELVRDGTADARAAGVIPRTNEVQKYVQGIVENLEKRTEDNRLRLKPKAPEKPAVAMRSTEAMESEYQKRARRFGIKPTEGKWTVTRKPADALSTLNSQRKSVGAVRLRARLRLLASKPDWSAKLKCINPLALQGQLGPEKQKHAEHLVREVIAASEAVFGPWWKAPAQSLWFSGK